MSFKLGIWMLLYSIFLGFQNGEAAKITMLHMFGGSHHMTTRVIGEELAKRGHEVSICAPGKKSSSSNNLKLIGYDGGVTKEEERKFSQDQIKNSQAGFLQKIRTSPQILVMISRLCEKMVVNKDVIDAVKQADMIVLEMMLFCAPAFVQSHEKKFVAISPVPVATFASAPFRVPLNPSYVPFYISHWTDEMGFGQRVINMILHKISQLAITMYTNNLLGGLHKELKVTSDTDIYSLIKEAQILLASCDYVSEYPSPLMPNTFCVGAFSTGPSKPLPPDIENIANSTDGFIVVAMGTVFNTLTREQVRIMAGAFERLKEKVIWQLQDPYDVTLPKNVVTMKWLPQNDLLGHPNIKLFISHVGTSSLQQSVYHGVPVLATPRAADQWSNGYKLANRVKTAEVINIETVTEEVFFEKIQLLLTTDRYRINAQKASRRIKTRKQTPMQIAGDLIEYVIDNDYDVSHLRAHALDLPWYIHDMWDIYLFLFVLLHLWMIGTYYTLKALFRACRRRKIKSE